MMGGATRIIVFLMGGGGLKVVYAIGPQVVVLEDGSTVAGRQVKDALEHATSLLDRDRVLYLMSDKCGVNMNPGIAELFPKARRLTCFAHAVHNRFKL